MEIDGFKHIVHLAKTESLDKMAGRSGMSSLVRNSFAASLGTDGRTVAHGARVKPWPESQSFSFFFNLFLRHLKSVFYFCVFCSCNFFFLNPTLVS